MRQRGLQIVLAAATTAAAGVSVLVQSPAPDMAYEANADLLKLPENIFLGEVAGVATSSRGHIFVYTRTGHPYATLGDARTFYRAGSRLFQFDQTGKFMRELGQDLYGFNAAQQVRVDAQDNVWTLDAGANQVVKFDSNGVVQLVLGRKPEVIGVRPGAAGGGGRGAGGPTAAAGTSGPGSDAAGASSAAPGAGGRASVGGPSAAAGIGGRGGGRGPGAGAEGSSFSRPSDVAWDRSGNIFVADGVGSNNRVAKFDKDGKFVTSWGQTGAENGQFNGVTSMATDAQGNVYVADAGNRRIQVFDGEGTFKSQITGIGTPLAICISRGPTQYIYSSHSGDPDGMVDAAIYKVSLEGKVLGKFGSAGKLLKQFGLVNSIDCRTEDELLIGEMTNWRVQKIMLRPGK